MPEKILIVDDDSDMLKILRWSLSSLGEILEASDGSAALRLVKSQRPRLILLDVAMPKMSGIEALKRIRAIDQKVIVVMLTGLIDIAVAKEALDNGACAYITKPFEDTFLCAEVARLLGKDGAGAESASGRPWRVAPG
jgi:DNA-binding response OmpR family regulator